MIIKNLVHRALYFGGISMHNNKIVFWFIVIIFWCDGQNADIVEQIRDSRQEKYGSSKTDGGSRSSFSLLSDTISQVSHESEYQG